MNVKRLLAVTTCLVLAVAAGWTFLVVSYETDLEALLVTSRRSLRDNHFE